MTNSRVSTLSCLALIVCGLGCAKANIVSVAHPEAGEYATLVYIGEGALPDGYQRSDIPADVKAVLAETLREEIVTRSGYVGATAETADLLLYAAAGVRTDVESQRITAGAGGRLEIPNLGEYERSVDRGTLVFDVFAREGGLHVWHGQLSGVIRDGEELDADVLNALLIELFSTLPHRGSYIG